MDREILFRAKRADDGKWIEGLPTYDVNGNLAEFDVYNGFSDCDVIEIDSETVCQYTGLCDKNGVKIFEGDILQGKSKRAYVVRYSDDIAGFVARGTGVSLTPCMNCGTMRCYAVVGNVFDDPGLMEVDGDEKV